MKSIWLAVINQKTNDKNYQIVIEKLIKFDASVLQRAPAFNIWL